MEPLSTTESRTKSPPPTPKKPDHLRRESTPALPERLSRASPVRTGLEAEGVQKGAETSSSPAPDAATSDVDEIKEAVPSITVVTQVTRETNGILNHSDAHAEPGALRGRAGASGLLSPKSEEATDHEDRSRSPRRDGSRSPSKWGVGRDKIKQLSVIHQLRPDKLCDGCRKLDLTIDKFVIDNRPSKSVVQPNFLGKRRMGSVAELEANRTCPLCRLLLQALKEQSKEDRKDSGSEPTQQTECFLHWKVDGRERVKENARVRTVKRTRRLCIEWSNVPSDEAYIVLVAPEGKYSEDGQVKEDGHWEQPTLFLGRLGTSSEKSSIEMIKSWLNLCMEHHETECHVQQDLKERFEDLRFSSFFTVIDVLEMKLTHLPAEDENARYVALSYTWGEETRISGGHGPSASEARPLFKTTTKNIEQLEKKEGIRHSLKKNMPMAIQNAIYLTEQLGYRYLWVDSLCITQDDSHSWQLNAGVMDVVYGNANITICAADGESAEEGLIALFRRPGSALEKEYTAEYKVSDQQRFKLLLSRPSEFHIQQSRWNNRAWTFQERLVSRRCLIFVAGRMYLQCRSTTMCEDIYSEAATAGWSVELQGAPAHTLKRLHEDPVSVFKKCLDMYTSRRLSREEDVLDAFAGIANRLRGAIGQNCEIIYGLPISHFDWALLWEPDEAPERREVKGRRFPSWSWCGWKGKKISYKHAIVSGPEINLHEWLLKHTWITFYIRDVAGNLRLIWDPLRHEPSLRIEDRWKGYNSRKAGLPAGTRHDDDVAFPEYDYYGRPFNTKIHHQGRVPSLGQQFVRKTEAFRRNVRVLKPNDPAPYKESYPLLQFWTFSSNFYLGEENDLDRFSSGKRLGAGLKRFAILDNAGDFAGTCVLPERFSEAARMRVKQEFIALSDARDFDQSEYGCWNLYSEDERETVPWQLYNVMMLCYEEGKTEIAYRAGLGKVYKSAFDDGTESDEDHWKEIILG